MEQEAGTLALLDPHWHPGHHWTLVPVNRAIRTQAAHIHCWDTICVAAPPAVCGHLLRVIHWGHCVLHLLAPCEANFSREWRRVTCPAVAQVKDDGVSAGSWCRCKNSVPYMSPARHCSPYMSPVHSVHPPDTGDKKDVGLDDLGGAQLSPAPAHYIKLMAPLWSF